MIKRLLKKTLLLAIFLSVLLLVVFLSIGKKPINTFVEQQLVSAAQRQGIRLAFEEANIGLLSLSAKSAQLFVSPIFLLLPFQNLHIQPIWGSLLRGSLDAILTAQFSGSDTKLTATSISPSGATISGSLQKLDLASIQQLAMLGITSGIAEIHAEKIEINVSQDFPTSGMLAISAQRIEKPGQTTIPLSLGDFPLSLQLPPLKRGKMETIVNFGDAGRALVIRKFDFLSSWGALSFSGDLSNDREISCKGEVHLSDEGSEAFRSFLPLISQGRLKYETKSFSFSVAGPLRRPQVDFSDLG